MNRAKPSSTEPYSWNWINRSLGREESADESNESDESNEPQGSDEPI